MSKNNKAKVLTTIGIVTGLVAIGYGLFRYFKGQITLATKYCYKIGNVKFIKMTKSRMVMDIYIKVLNRSNFELFLAGYSISLYLSDSYVLDVRSATSTVLNPNGISELVVRVDFDPQKTKLNQQKILDLISYALVDRKKFIIQVKGTLSAKINFINIRNMPIDFRTSLYDALKPSPPDNSDYKCEIDWGK